MQRKTFVDFLLDEGIGGRYFRPPETTGSMIEVRGIRTDVDGITRIVCTSYLAGRRELENGLISFETCCHTFANAIDIGRIIYGGYVEATSEEIEEIKRGNSLGALKKTLFVKSSDKIH